MPTVPRITLTAGADSVTLPSPAPGVQTPITVPAATNRTPGGLMVQYKTAPAHYEHVLRIESMTTAQKVALEVFFRENWNEDITYTDETGGVFTVRFLDNALPLVKEYKGCWSVDLALDFSAVLN